MRSVPDVGPVLCRTFLAELPEFGTLPPGRLSALAGIAPLNRDCGTFRGTRIVRGDRVRAALYMGTLMATRHNSQIKEFYERLLASGKAKNVALVTCMRKLLTVLNVMLRNRIPWRCSHILNT